MIAAPARSESIVPTLGIELDILDDKTLGRGARGATDLPSLSDGCCSAFRAMIYRLVLSVLESWAGAHGTDWRRVRRTTTHGNTGPAQDRRHPNLKVALYHTQ